MLEGAILGFDVGTKRIGMAVGQTVTSQAKPLSTLKRLPGGEPPWSAIQEAIDTWGAKALIVGIPLNMDGTQQKITVVSRRFATDCVSRFQLPVFGVDERLSTVEARQRVFDEAGYRGLQKAEIDSVVAALLIEQWLLSGQQAQEEFS